MSARLKLATCELEGHVGYLWAYVMPNSPAERPNTDFWVEIMVPGESKSRLIPAILGDEPSGKEYVAISDVCELIQAQNAKELYAFVAYAFLRATHDGEPDVPEHIVPIDESFVKHLKALCIRPEFRECMINTPRKTASDPSAGVSGTFRETDNDRAKPSGQTTSLSSSRKRDGDRNAENLSRISGRHGSKKRGVPTDQGTGIDRRVRAKFRRDFWKS